METILCAHGNPAAIKFVVPELDPSDERLIWSDDCPDCAALLDCDVAMLALRAGQDEAE